MWNKLTNEQVRETLKKMYEIPSFANMIEAAEELDCKLESIQVCNELNYAFMFGFLIRKYRNALQTIANAVYERRSS